jgi:hypothetical protein
MAGVTAAISCNRGLDLVKLQNSASKNPRLKNTRLAARLQFEPRKRLISYTPGLAQFTAWRFRFFFAVSRRFKSSGI